MDIHCACDYIILKVHRNGGTLNVRKLQKFLYYAQAWHLALQGESLFQGKFQAWPQGPINREVYDRFAASKSLDSELQESDISKDFDPAQLSARHRMHLDRVLQAYAKYAEPALQQMIAQQAPWQEASGHGAERCEREIDEQNMRRYYTIEYLAGLRVNDPRAPSLIPVFSPTDSTVCAAA